MYRQYDGYLEGHGKELADFLNGIEMINGITVGARQNYGTHANGVGCLAAQMVSHFKNGEIGGIYLESVDSGLEDYNYVLHFDYQEGEDKWFGSDVLKQIDVSCWNDEPFFKGTLDEFVALIEKKIKE